DRSNRSRRSAVCGRRLDLPAGLPTQALFGTDRVNRPARVADIKADRPLVRRIRVALDRVLTVAAAADPGVSAGDDVRIRSRTALRRGCPRHRRAHDREHPRERTWAGCTLWTLRTCGTLRARDSLRTLRAWRAGIALWAWRTSGTWAAGCACCSHRTSGSHWTWRTCGTWAAGCACCSHRTSGSHWTWRTSGTWDAGCACCSHRTSGSHRPWRTCGPWRTGRTSGTWRTSGAGGTC